MFAATVEATRTCKLTNGGAERSQIPRDSSGLIRATICSNKKGPDCRCLEYVCVLFCSWRSLWFSTPFEGGCDDARNIKFDVATRDELPAPQKIIMMRRAAWDVSVTRKLASRALGRGQRPHVSGRLRTDLWVGRIWRLEKNGDEEAKEVGIWKSLDAEWRRRSPRVSKGAD